MIKSIIQSYIQYILPTDPYQTGHRPSQFKKISDALPVLWAGKNFRNLYEVLWTGRDLIEDNSMPPYPDTNLWSTTHHVQVNIVDQNDDTAEVTGERPVCYQMMEQAYVFDANLLKELLLWYK